MRCIDLFPKIIMIKKIMRWCALPGVVGLLSSPITSIADASSINATQLIQSYLQQNPVDKSALQQSVNQQILQFSNLSTSDIQAVVQAPHQIDLSIYPVRSMSLTPGKVTARSIDIMLPQPIFIIGDDEQSREWLQNYAARLIQIQAQGFVVNVNSGAAMESLRQLVPNLSIYPMPGDSIARCLNIQHYPVLISNQLIEQ